MMKLLVTCLVLLPFVMVAVTGEEEKEPITSCQVCAYSELAKTKLAGDADCRDAPKKSKFSKGCGNGASTSDPWKCAIGILKKDDDSFYERMCLLSSQCTGSKVKHVIGNKNVEGDWKCCDEENNCNHGNGLHGNGVLWLGVAAVSVILTRV